MPRSSALAQQASPPALDVPYVPTPEEVVNRMLELGEIKPTDFVMDLGCGDGRMLVMASTRFGVKGYGVDIDPRRIEEAQANAKKNGVDDKIKFEVKNLFDTPIGDASVLLMYLLPRVNLELRPRIFKEMKPGSRIVSHQFDMGEWKAEATEQLGHRTVYKWTVPAQVGGRWRVTRDGGAAPITLDLKQDQWQVSGTANVGGKASDVKNAEIVGMKLSLEVDGAGRLEGTVNGSQIAGKGWKGERVQS
jgi:SAM-dependent methyltransferase